MRIWSMLQERYAAAADPLRTERKIEMAVLVLGLLVCLLLLYSAIRLGAGSNPAAVSPAADALEVGVLQTFSKVGTEQSSEVRARPLFWPSRRPIQEVSGPGPEEEKLVAKAQELKDVKLLGVFGGGDTSGVIALVKGKKQRILLGEKLNGWTLQSVEPNSIVLVDGAREQELLLKPVTIIAAAPQAGVPKAGAPKAGVPQAGGGASTAVEEEGLEIEQIRPSMRGLRRGS